MNPLDALANFFLGLIHQGKMTKWYRLTATCLVAGPIGFFGGWGLTASNLLASGHGALLSLAWGFAAGCTMLAAVVLTSAIHSGVWKDMSITLPPEFQKVLLETDLGQTEKGKDAAP